MIEEMMPEDMGGQSKPPAKKKSPPMGGEKEGGKVYITPPKGLDLSEFRGGKEASMVSKFKMDGGRLCLVSINGVPISQSTEEDDEESSPEEGTDQDPDAAMEGQEEEENPNQKPGDRFMQKFRAKRKPVF